MKTKLEKDKHVATSNSQMEVEAITARIDEQENRGKQAVVDEQVATAERKRLLTAGNDADVDAAERRIDEARTQQVRVQERIEELTAQRLAAVERAQSDSLDAMSAKARRLAAHGGTLISRYAKLAPAIAAIIDELHTTSAALEGINHTLSRAGRAPIADANAVRCTPGKQAEIEERVTVMPGDPKHPAFGTTRMVDNDRRHAPHLVSTIDGSIIGPAEITATRIQHVAGDHQPPLQHAVNLPSAEAASPPYWQAKHPNEHRRADQAKVDALLKELGLPSPSKAA